MFFALFGIFICLIVWALRTRLVGDAMGIIMDKNNISDFVCLGFKD